MKLSYLALLFSLFLLPSFNANAAGAMLRVVCDGDAVGAEVRINGKFKGECPVDISIPEGKYKLKVVKAVDGMHERVFEQDVRVADGTIKKVEAVLTTRLNAEAQKREDIRLAEEVRKGAEFDAERASGMAQAGNIFRDCEICPEMVVIPPGSFDMGESNVWMPVHRVTIGRPFALGRFEVTQAQWRAVMGNNPSSFSNCGDNCPVENVSWNDAQAFIQKFNAKTGKHYRLPSEAEWEYAARAGTTTDYPWGDQPSHEYANYGEDKMFGGGLAEGRDQWINTSPVGSFPANAFGLYDMAGNVLEWVEDTAHIDYNGAPVDGGVWNGGGTNRMLRGAGWHSMPQFLTSAYRVAREPDFRGPAGFRLAR